MFILENLVQNGSFEQGTGDLSGGVLPVPHDNTTIIPPWQAKGQDPSPSLNAPIAWGRNGNSYQVTTDFGTRFVDLTGFRDNPAGDPGSVRQTIATKAGRKYRFSFQIGVSDGAQFNGPVSVTAIVNSKSQQILRATGGNPNVTSPRWHENVYHFVALDDRTEIIIQAASAKGGHYIGLDDVVVRRAIFLDFLIRIFSTFFDFLIRFRKGPRVTKQKIKATKP